MSNSYVETVELLTDLEGVSESADTLNDWERGFIKSIRTQVNAGRPLSDKQMAKVKSIWNKIFDEDEDDDEDVDYSDIDS